MFAKCRVAVGCVVSRVLCAGALAGASLLVGSAAVPVDQAAWPGIERVVAVGDVHGDFEQFVAVLRDAGVIDEDHAWIAGEARLVQLGDVLDRGADSRKVMDLLMRLEGEAAEAGGRVHALIGNHETMNLYGDLHDVSPGEFAAFVDENSEAVRDSAFEVYVERLLATTDRPPEIDEAFRQEFDERFPLGYVEHRQAFAPTGRYGAWIRSHDTIVKIDESLFLHGGISPKFATTSVDAINAAVRTELVDVSRLRALDVLESSVVGDPEGPLWFRGLVNQPEPELAAHVDAVLAFHGVKRIVVAHTPNLGTVFPRFGGKVLSIDVGLSAVYGGPPVSLVIEHGTPYSWHRGTRLDLRAAFGGAVVGYLRRAAALEPEGSAFKQRVEALVIPREEAPASSPGTSPL